MLYCFHRTKEQKIFRLSYQLLSTSVKVSGAYIHLSISFVDYIHSFRSGSSDSANFGSALFHFNVVKVIQGTSYG